LSNLAFAIIALFISFLAGVFGSLTGLGGGLLIVPLLNLGFGIDLHHAIGTSLISIIATSCASSIKYISYGFVNLRLAMLFGIPMTLGSIFGALIAFEISTKVISLVFGIVLFASALFNFLKRNSQYQIIEKDHYATFFKLNSSYLESGKSVEYNLRHIPFGTLLMFIGGALSSLLGIGSGVINVPTLENLMKLPLRVSAGTSTLMIGVTAIAGIGLYLPYGYVDPIITFPVVLGILLGSFIGSALMKNLKVKLLRQIFIIFTVIIAYKMVYNAFQK
jgi:uncharacterized membrane protein YfcA